MSPDRDLLGYAGAPPDPRWPGGAKVALSFVLNFEEGAEFSVETGADGQARLEFEMPHLTGAEPALVIEATQADSKGQLKFQLKTRPRVPTA